MQSPFRDNRIRERIDVIEACCDFMQACAAQGLSTDSRARSGRRLRVLMAEAISAMKGIAEHCATVIEGDTIEAADRLMEFLAVVDRDACDSVTLMEPVLAEPIITFRLLRRLLS